MHDAPLVSCLMVTRQRLAMAKRAIDCYAAQDYDARELVIVCDGEGDRDTLERYAATRCGQRVTVTEHRLGSLSLGALRNTAIALARGGVICQWDDDDLSHPLRLSHQVELMLAEHADGCFMTDQLHLMARTGSLYWCDWARPHGRPLPWPTIPNTLLCRKDAIDPYPESGPLSRRSEDAYVMRSLLKRKRVSRLGGHGWLYVYVCHGANTWHEGHHLDIVRATGMTARELLHRKGELAAAMSSHTLGDLVVRDETGLEVYRIATSGVAGAASHG